jgi:prepilin-type N-terminal cleavage/methylation domain-containing protein
MQTLRLQRPPPCGTHARACFVFVRRAYTLIELVLVLIIMGTIAAIAAPRLSQSLARQRADGAADRIVSDLAYARALARTSSSSVTVTFDPPHNRYAIPGPDPLHNTGAPYIVDLSQDPYQASVLGGAAASVGSPTPNTGSGNGTFSITFDGFGEASSTGWVVVKSGSWSREISLDSSARTTVTRVSDTDVKALIP